MLNKNDIVPLKIESISNDGSGVARHEGMAVFVPMTAPEDVIEAKIVKALKTHAFGIIDKITEPGACRVEPGCPVYRLCGGCSLRHIDYGTELAIKSGWVGDALRRLGGITANLEEPIASPKIERYRNKAQYPVRNVNGEICAGFFRAHSHGLVRVEDCPLQPGSFALIVKEMLAFCREFNIPPYDETAQSGILRHIFLRKAETTGETMLCLVINAKKLPFAEQLVERLAKACPEVSTITLNVNRERTNVIFGEKTITLSGCGVITDELCGVRLELSARSFYQVNRAAAELLYKAALEYAAPQGAEVLLDLYCGAGAIGLSMAGHVKEVIGVELEQAAVKDAGRNAALNGVSNARFIHADAEKTAQRLAEEGISPDIIVVDPPRKGLGPGLPETIAGMKPQRLVYISCNPATLARDSARLNALGYTLEKVKAVDLFPKTAHVEAVALFTSSQSPPLP
jgi:23S rRNA (uracil1939-C5)-methyltransferase